MELLETGLTVIFTVILLWCGYVFGKEAGYNKGVVDGMEKMQPKNDVDISYIAAVNEELEKSYIDEDLAYAKGETSISKVIEDMAEKEEDELFKKIVYGGEND